MEKGLDCNLIRNVDVFPPNIRCAHLQRGGGGPAIEADDVKIPAQVDTDCGAQKARGTGNDDDLFMHILILHLYFQEIKVQPIKLWTIIR